MSHLLDNFCSRIVVIPPPLDIVGGDVIVWNLSTETDFTVSSAFNEIASFNENDNGQLHRGLQLLFVDIQEQNHGEH